MTPTDRRYSLTELADLAGVSPRTVRYYQSQGLLASPGVPGPGAKYDDDDLARLRLIRRLQREHLPLADIRHRLDGLPEAAITQLAEEAARAPAAASAMGPALAEPAGLASAAPVDSALAYVQRLLSGGRRGAEPARPALLRSNPPPLAAVAPAEPASSATPPAPARSVVPSGHEPSAPLGAAPPSIERSQWERISLAPDIELHVRRPLTRLQSRQVDRLVSIARDLLEEEPS